MPRSRSSGVLKLICKAPKISFTNFKDFKLLIEILCKLKMEVTLLIIPDLSGIST